MNGIDDSALPTTLPTAIAVNSIMSLLINNQYKSWLMPAWTNRQGKLLLSRDWSSRDSDPRFVNFFSLFSIKCAGQKLLTWAFPRISGDKFVQIESVGTMFNAWQIHVIRLEANLSQKPSSAARTMNCPRLATPGTRAALSDFIALVAVQFRV